MDLPSVHTSIVSISCNGNTRTAEPEIEPQRLATTHEKSGFWPIERLIHWVLRSPHKLRCAERFLLSRLKTDYNGFFVDIGSVVGNTDQIWTIALNTKASGVPLVALHGLGGGLALWLLNLDAFAQDRPVYAIDLLGFGRSSRSKFSDEPSNCEQQFVEALDEWRRELKIRRMVLLGHSLGAFIASSYALTYPDRVKHLILGNPWGFEEAAEDLPSPKTFWATVGERLGSWLKPYWKMQLVGNSVLHASTVDLYDVFKPMLADNVTKLAQYMQQCKAATHSGDTAFCTLSRNSVFAKRPMIRRISDLHAHIGITFIYGSSPWATPETGAQVKALRQDACVEVRRVECSGYHIHFEHPVEFNRLVVEACRRHGGLAKSDLVIAQLSQIFWQQRQLRHQQQQDQQGHSE